MSTKYKDWKDNQIAILEYYGEFSHITKEDLYQEFKERLIEELFVDSVHLPQPAPLKDVTKK